MRRPCLRSFAVALLAVAIGAAPLRAVAEDLTIFAAASLATVLDEVADAWTAETGTRVTLSYAGSSALARQIQAGAPADIFISASTQWMDALHASGDIREGSRRDILGNRLVLIAHGRSVPPVTIERNLDILAMLGNGRLAMALVDAVPAGVYGKQALTSLGLWDAVEPRVAQADNVRAALFFVAQNEAPLGIVYATDAAVEDEVTVIGTFPAGSHDPIQYPAGITAHSDSPFSDDFLRYLSSDAARRIWLEHGFSVPD